jgi:hypothetical protein
MSRLNRSIHHMLVLALVLLAGGVHAAAPQPQADGWSRWSVPLQPGLQAPCCWKLRGGGADPDRGCVLDDTDGGMIISDRDGVPAGERLWVYVKRKAGQTLSVRSFGSSCPVRSETPVLTLADPVPADSVSFLQAQLDSGGRRIGDETLAAIAFHGDGSATSALIAASAAAEDKERREQALFWLGQARGEEGLPHILEVVRTDPSARIRKHSLFVLSQSKLPAARDALRERTQRDADAAVRSQGLFWLAQVDDAQTLPLGLALLADPTQSRSHDETVFALSQLPDGKGEDALIALVDGDYSRTVKKQALFWLGQSGSDKALRYLDRLLADGGG